MSKLKYRRRMSIAIVKTKLSPRHPSLGIRTTLVSVLELVLSPLKPNLLASLILIH
jgi:hypothetical protein